MPTDQSLSCRLAISDYIYCCYIILSHNQFIA